MTAAFTPDAGLLITLAGADAGQFDQPKGITYEAAGIVQTEAIVRGTAPLRFHRGNVMATVGFVVEKSYDTWDAANRANVDLVTDLTAALGEFTLADGTGTFLTLTSASVRVRSETQGSVAVRTFTVEGLLA